jgi:hypothetical protein
MSESEVRLRKKTLREERLRKKTLRLRHPQFLQEDAARQLRSRENTRLVKEKASEQRLWDEVKALQKKYKARQEVVYVYSDEDSDEDSDKDSEEDSNEDSEEDSEEDTDRNTCLSLSCVVVFFLVSNLLIMQFVLTRQE